MEQHEMLVNLTQRYENLTAHYERALTSANNALTNLKKSFTIENFFPQFAWSLVAKLSEWLFYPCVEVVAFTLFRKHFFVVSFACVCNFGVGHIIQIYLPEYLKYEQYLFILVLSALIAINPRQRRKR